MRQLLTLSLALAFTASVLAQTSPPHPSQLQQNVGLMATAAANEWVRDIEVTQVGTYLDNDHHYVWFSVTPETCRTTSPNVMFFNDTQPGGKAMLASLTTALTAKRKVDVNATGCQIVELYLK
jgi:hypothetical protein